MQKNNFHTLTGIAPIGWVKRPLLARVPSLAKFFVNLTEITRVKEWVVDFFFFTEAVNTVV